MKKVAPPQVTPEQFNALMLKLHKLTEKTDALFYMLNQLKGEVQSDSNSVHGKLLEVYRAVSRNMVHIPEDYQRILAETGMTLEQYVDSSRRGRQ